MPKLPEDVANVYKVVNYKHTRFIWKTASYDLSTLKMAQANELYATKWPYLVKVKKLNKIESE